MSLLSVVLVVFLAMVLLALVVAAGAMFTPVVFIVDSARGQMSVRWLVALEYRRPLPGTEGGTRLEFAGKRIRLGARKGKARRERAARPREGRGAPTRFFSRCLRDSTIRRAVFRQLAALGKGILGSADITRWRASVSLPDPATTGMLFGLGQTGWGRGLGVEANFTGENSVFLEIRLWPHRILKAVLYFVMGLPYRAMFREWRGVRAEAAA